MPRLEPNGLELVRLDDSEAAQAFGAEMKQETDLQPSAPQVVAQLSYGILSERASGFHFNDNLVVNDNVEPLRAELVALVKDRNGDLTTDFMPSVAKLSLESHHVHVLEKAIAQGVVDLESAAYYRVRQLFFDELGMHAG